MKLTNAQHRALELLAALGPHGSTETMLMANGFKLQLLIDLVRNGLASTVTESIPAGGRTVEVMRLRITDVGRQVLAENRGT
jgi:hypothetical protein